MWISDIDRLAELRGLQRLHGEFRWGERRRRIWSLPLIEVLEICVSMVLICYGAGRGREKCLWIGKEGVGGKELTRGEMGFAEVLKLVIIRTRDDKLGRVAGCPLRFLWLGACFEGNSSHYRNNSQFLFFN